MVAEWLVIGLALSAAGRYAVGADPTPETHADLIDIPTPHRALAYCMRRGSATVSGRAVGERI